MKDLDRVDLAYVHERKKRSEGAVGHHLIFRILPACHDCGLRIEEESKC